MAGIATVTLLVLMTATVILGMVIVFGRAMRRIRDARRTRLAAPDPDVRGVIARALENIGYRQLTAFWRVQGAWSALVGSQHEWGVMTRTGFGGRHTL